jgi:hypothetical protein
MTGIVRPILERFEAKFIPEPNSGCWLWTSAVNSGGYGTFSIRHSKSVMAHRFAYEIYKSEIPHGLEVDHRCFNRQCVNPDHLDAVSRKINVHRALYHRVVEPAKKVIPKTHCRRGHEHNEENSYFQDLGNGRRQRFCRRCRAIADSNRHSKKRSKINAL